jgi:hypothetical protein
MWCCICNYGNAHIGTRSKILTSHVKYLVVYIHVQLLLKIVHLLVCGCVFVLFPWSMLLRHVNHRVLVSLNVCAFVLPSMRTHSCYGVPIAALCWDPLCCSPKTKHTHTHIHIELAQTLYGEKNVSRFASLSNMQVGMQPSSHLPSLNVAWQDWLNRLSWDARKMKMNL